jgi:hypothetical protein
VCENGVLSTIFGPKREKIGEGREKLHKTEPHNMQRSTNVSGITKSRRMRCARHVARMGKNLNVLVYRVLVKKAEKTTRKT